MTNDINKKLNDRDCRVVVTLDGPSASGKGHIGRELAKRFDLKYVESGKVYRGLAYECLRNNVSPDDVVAITELSKSDILAKINQIDLNNEEIGQLASKIATIPLVRKNLTKGLVKKIAENQRIIMEGRDIGTVVAPNADLKIFITADVEVRAERRFKQLQEEEKKCMLPEILESLKKRDLRDINRSDAPLEIADSAIVIDTSNLTPLQVIEQLLDRIINL